jgi:hypothetical protein
MKTFLLLVALCAAIAVPAIVLAQQGGPPGPMGPGGWHSPSPQMRAAMDKAHADAKVAAYAALSPAHATQVQAIVSQVAAGTLDRRAAGAQIDALLTPDEQKSVLAAGEKARSEMRAAMAANGMAPPPGPPSAAGPPPPPGAAGPPQYGRFGPPSAGRVLLMLSRAPDQMRSTMPGPRRSSAP